MSPLYPTVLASAVSPIANIKILGENFGHLKQLRVECVGEHCSVRDYAPKQSCDAGNCCNGRAGMLLEAGAVHSRPWCEHKCASCSSGGALRHSPSFLRLSRSLFVAFQVRLGSLD